MKAKKVREIRIRFYEADLTEDIEAAGYARSQDDYVILFSDRLDHDGVTAAVVHEFLHIWHKDFNAPCNVARLEQERHREQERLFPDIFTA